MKKEQSKTWQPQTKHAAQPQDDATIRVDLHCHSSWSDGTLPPAEVAYMLYQNGVKIAALTDHDTIMGLKAFQKALAQYDISYIPGAEITASYQNDTLHILAYGFDEEDDALKTLLYGRPVTGSDELVQTDPRSAPDVIGLIHRAGGIAVLAHPLVTQPDLQKLDKLIGELKAIGLDGIEAQYGPNTQEQNEALYVMAKEWELTASMGTDFHDLAKDTSGITVARKDWNAFRDALLHTPFAMHADAQAQTKEKKGKNAWYSFALNIILPAVLSLALFVVSLFVFFLPYFENTLMSIKRENIRQLSQAAYGVLNEAVQEVNAGRMTLAEAQSLAKDRISAMRYGVDDKDYFWIQDLTPRILMHPYRTDLNDMNVSDFKDAEGNRIFVEFADLAQREGEGYISYVWQWMDDPGRVEAKESYIRFFEPWGWIIGTGIYANDVQSEINTLRGYVVVISGGVIGIVLILLIYLIHHGIVLEHSRQDAQRLLLESTHRYKALSEAATEGALFIAGGRCRYANAVVYEILGCAYGRIDLLYLRDIFPETEENEEWLRLLRGDGGGGVKSTVDGVIKRCDGSLELCTLTVKHDVIDSVDGLMILVKRKTEPAGHTGSQAALNRLLHIPGMMASELAEAITKADTPHEIALLCKKTPEFVTSLLENGTSSIAIANMVALITDIATQRLIKLAIRELGEPPADFAFLALGSQGRQAQSLYSDQDNALVYTLPDGKDEESLQTYFNQLASSVCDNLELAGYVKCRGGMIAANPKWCKSVTGWKADFKQRIREGEPKQIMEFSTLLDLRTVYGNATLEEEIRDYVYAEIADDRQFIKLLAQNAVAFKTPLRLFGGIMATGSEGINIKMPEIAIVSFARLYAIRHGVKEPNTLKQLDAIKRLSVISEARHREIVDSYELLLRLRLWNQILSIERNEKLDNYIDADRLGRVESAALKESFKEIDALQGIIEHDYLGIV
ncbi:MAG TPA: DUF294 nucleotidyltransferase-like domain-containing protein [Candidatus Limiplasma sp.]|nr:DUF294 nucleotidyltransferase-like domain-containing protein [Candidatus Limiplasma sp.]HRX08539.1 DUF294 nucleotidyltransferase-like domain-containing protein [Candidatus Limiplasma sp.]